MKMEQDGGKMMSDQGKKKEVKDQNKKEKNIRIMAVILISVSLVIAVVFVIFLRNRYDDGDDTEVTGITIEDAETYYRKHATVISVTDADPASFISEKEMKKELEKRGFSQYPLKSSFSKDGELLDEDTFEKPGKSRHPIYEISYKTGSGDLWTVTVMNGCYKAFPVTYNQKLSGKEVIFSESERIMAYDAESGRYFELKPNQDETIVGCIEKVDAAHLDQLTEKEIDGYVR